MTEKKNRPTPKRKEAEAKRTFSSLAPAATKEQKKQAKAAARVARAKQREAYIRGDESALPARDKGPARRFVRNYVDSRRTLSERVIPMTFFVLILTVTPSPMMPRLNMTYTSLFGFVLMYVVIIMSFVEAFTLSRKIKKAVLEKYPDTHTKGLGLYGWMRATQMRRTRMPKPVVKIGDRNF